MASVPTSADPAASFPDAEDEASNLPIDAVERVDPELRALLKKMPATTTFNKQWKINICTFLMSIPGPTLKGVKSTKIKGGVGRLYFPGHIEKDSIKSTGGAAALMWIHGGGRIMGSASGVTESMVCSKLVKQLGVPVLSASYRLAPKHPFPAALDDLHAAYEWLAQYLKGEYNGSDVRIAVAGESAGGGLAAELCQRLLDESKSGGTLPNPVAQLLVYPMLDDRTCVNERKANGPQHFVWNSTSNQYGWSSYLGPDFKPGGDKIPVYAAAARRDDLSSLPPAWIVAGDLDLFRDECKAYADRLEDAGVETKYVELRGAFHGFFVMGENEEPVVKVWESFVEFGRRHLLTKHDL